MEISADKRFRSPSTVIDLTNWYITLPTGQPKKPDCVYQPDLNSLANEYFYLHPTGNVVVFKAPCGGVTTKNSKYPRSELREMMNAGKDKASWSTTSGVHTMTYTASVQHLPPCKPSVIVGQVHDGKNDVVVIKLNKRSLDVFYNSKRYCVLDDNYTTGVKFSVKIHAEKGRILVYYNNMDAPKATITEKCSTCYFKIGCYTQSSPAKGDKPDEYAEVWVYDANVSHR